MSNFAPAAEFAVQVISGLAEESAPIGVSELSRKLGINKNMVFRILNSLEQQGWIYCQNPDEKKYALTLKPFAVTSRAVSRLNISAAAAPALHKLWQSTGESTYLGVLHGDKVLYLQHFDGTGLVRVAGTVGGMYPLHCSAPGKVLLAHCEKDTLQQLLSAVLSANTDHTITKKETLQAELEKIRLQGFSTDDEEFGRGIFCLAAPVFDCSGTVVAAVGCSVSTALYTRQQAMARLQAPVLQAAGQISACLGFLPDETCIVQKNVVSFSKRR